MTTLRLITEGTALESELIQDYYDVYRIMKFMGKEEREKFYVLHLSAKNRVLAMELVAVGTLTDSNIHPREVFKAAVHNNSAKIICIHNHPSGDVTPSLLDLAMTERLKAAGELLGIEVLDHIIIGFEAVCSINEYLENQRQKGKNSRKFAKERLIGRISELRKAGLL